MIVIVVVVFVFFKQKTAYEMRISDWSSDVCSSDLAGTSPASFRRQPRKVPVGRETPASRPGGAHPASRVRAQRARGANQALRAEIGRASCRDRACKYV